jgi:hypothetical protein
MPVNQKVPNVPRFPLSVLRVYEQQLRDKEEYTIGSIGKALPLCPSLVRLDIRLVKEMTDTDLLGITTLKMLRELALYRWKVEEMGVTFDGGLLVEIGNSLTYLNLFCFGVVNFSAIIKYCPNLSYLTVGLSRHSIYSPPKLKQLFRTECRREKFCLSQLEMLNLQTHSSISSDIWFGLLYSPFLNYVHIRGCDALTDDVFQNATKVGRFQNLETLYLTSCRYNISGNWCVNDRCESSMSYTLISFYYCENLTREDINQHLKMKCQDKKWALTWNYNGGKLR